MGELYRIDGYMVDPQEKTAWKIEGGFAIDEAKPYPLTLMTEEVAFFASEDADETGGVLMFGLSRQGLPCRLLSDNFLASNEFAETCQSLADGLAVGPSVVYSDARAKACVDSMANDVGTRAAAAPYGVPRAELYESESGLDLFYVLADGTPAWWRRYPDRFDEAAADYSGIVCSGADPLQDGWPGRTGDDARDALGKEGGSLVARGSHAAYDSSFESLGISTGRLGPFGRAFLSSFFPLRPDEGAAVCGERAADPARAGELARASALNAAPAVSEPDASRARPR